MTPSLRVLAELMQIDGLAAYYDDKSAMLRHRDEIKSILAAAIAKRTTADWLAVLQPADIWCSEVLDWPQVLASEAWRLLDFEQIIPATPPSPRARAAPSASTVKAKSQRAAPALGADQERSKSCLPIQCRREAAPPCRRGCAARISGKYRLNTTGGTHDQSQTQELTCAALPLLLSARPRWPANSTDTLRV